MAVECEKLWNWSLTCDWSNLAAVTVEIIVAFLISFFAIIMAVYFYVKENEDRTKLNTLIKEQSDMMQNMNEIIVKQSKYIQTQEDLRKTRIENATQELIEDLENMKSFLDYVIKISEKQDYTEMKKKYKERMTDYKRWSLVSARKDESVLIGLGWFVDMKIQLHAIELDILHDIHIQISYTIKTLEEMFQDDGKGYPGFFDHIIPFHEPYDAVERVKDSIQKLCGFKTKSPV